MTRQMAILVGLTSVDPAAYDNWDGRSGCSGCELDVDNIGRILAPLGYTPTVLKTQNATRGAVLGALQSAASELQSGDTLVFYYSGHGGQQPDRNGDEQDGQDETLVTYDGEIIDDQLDRIWLQFRSGVRIIMLSDSCNSGTNYRNRLTITRGTPFEPLAPSAGSRMKAELIHLGGCRDGFTSAGYVTGGEFTLAVCKVWDGGRFKGSYQQFWAAIRDHVSGQEVQLNEYGPVSAAFRNGRPFTPSSGASPAGLQSPHARLGATASGRLVGPRFGARALGAPRAAGGIVAKWTRVESIVQEQLAGKFSGASVSRYGDATFYLPTVGEMQALLAASEGDRRTWMEERFDCDDFSYVLKGEASIHSYETGDLKFGLCVGIIWGNFSWVQGYHAVNWFIDAQGVLRLIEPQSDTMYGAEDCVGQVGLLVV